MGLVYLSTFSSFVMVNEGKYTMTMDPLGYNSNDYLDVPDRKLGSMVIGSVG